MLYNYPKEDLKQIIDDPYFAENINNKLGNLK